MTEKKKDLISSITLLGYAGILYIAADKLPTRISVSKVLNTGFYPQLLSIILAVLSILLLISALRKPSDADKGERVFKTRDSLLLFLLTMGMLALFPIVMEVLGFAVTCFSFVSIMVFLLSGKGKRNALVNLAVSLGITFLTYGVFKLLLAIPFPSGLLI